MKREIKRGLEGLKLKSTPLPLYIRFPREENDRVSMTGDGVPFNLKSYPVKGVLTPALDTLRFNNKEGFRNTRSFIHDKFHVFRILDSSRQSLSPYFSDINIICFDDDGYKIPQHFVALIRNYTSKDMYILIQKEGMKENFDTISVIIEPEISKTTDITHVARVDGLRNKINLEELESNSEDDLIPYAYNGEIRLDHSPYFLNYERETTVLKDKYIVKQESFFKNEYKNKKYPNIDLNITDVVSGNLSFKTEKLENIFWIDYNSLKNINLPINMSFDLYVSTSTNTMKYLTPGIDFYIGSDQRIAGLDSKYQSQRFEIIFKNNNAPRYILPFSSTEESVSKDDIPALLYHRYIYNWNVDLDKSFIIAFTDRKLSAEFPEFPISGSNIVIKIDDIIFNDNAEIAPEEISTVTFKSSPYTFNLYNSETITTDPGLITYGETNPTNYNTQEVFLYNANDNFKIDPNEPTFSGNADSYKIQNIEDEDLTSELKVFGDLQEKGILDHINTEVIRDIEQNLANVKKNYLEFLKSSSATFDPIMSGTKISTGNFLFLAIEGPPETDFDLIYYNGTTIIKKEYGCKVSEVDGKYYYISIPITNNFTHVSIEAESGDFSYYIFK